MFYQVDMYNMICLENPIVIVGINVVHYEIGIDYTIFTPKANRKILLSKSHT